MKQHALPISLSLSALVLAAVLSACAGVSAGTTPAAERTASDTVDVDFDAAFRTAAQTADRLDWNVIESDRSAGLIRAILPVAGTASTASIRLRPATDRRTIVEVETEDSARFYANQRADFLDALTRRTNAGK
jgi:hypothetical protein